MKHVSGVRAKQSKRVHSTQEARPGTHVVGRKLNNKRKEKKMQKRREEREREYQYSHSRFFSRVSNVTVSQCALSVLVSYTVA